MSFVTTVKDLVSVEITGKKDYSNLIAIPEQKKHLFFRAEDCSRTLFITDSKQISHFPEVWNRNKQVKVFLGQRAYENILMIVSGMGSKQKGESHSIFNFRSKWNNLRYGEKGQFIFKKLEKIGNSILEDAKFLQGNVFENSPKINFHRAARELTMKSPCEKVLIFGEVDVLVKAMAYTIGLTSTSKRLVDIIVTSGSQKNLLEQLCREKKLFGNITHVPLRSVMKSGFDGVKHVFMMTPLPLDLRLEFFDSWKERFSRDTKVVIVPSDNLKEMQGFERVCYFAKSSCIGTKAIIEYIEAEKEKRLAII